MVTMRAGAIRGTMSSPSMAVSGRSVVRNILVPLLFGLACASTVHAQMPVDMRGLADPVAVASRALAFGAPDEARAAIDVLQRRGEANVVATVILAMRFREDLGPDYLALFEALTGAKVEGWHQAMLWQQGHPEARPHASYRVLKLAMFERIDRAFRVLLGGERSDPDKMEIRLEELTWGGVRFDGIPSLDDPKMIPAAEAGYLLDDDLVFGIAINGDHRAYPLRVMGWHEMFNDTIGGVPVALAYCTLCGAGILFETKLEGHAPSLVFGSSGFLYRSNKLMFDRTTFSLWNQFTGEPVNGPFRGSGIKLKIRPVLTTTWSDWKARHPATTVLSLETGHERDYRSGVVYRDYFDSPDLMFPVAVADESRLKRKDRVFAMREVGAARAWPLDVFEGGAVINDAVGDRRVVLIGDGAKRTVRAYYRGEAEFSAGEAQDRPKGPGGIWTVTEDFLEGPKGERLPRAPGHLSYWFAWADYMGAQSTLYGAKR